MERHVSFYFYSSIIYYSFYKHLHSDSTIFSFWALEFKTVLKTGTPGEAKGIARENILSLVFLGIPFSALRVPGFNRVSNFNAMDKIKSMF